MKKLILLLFITIFSTRCSLQKEYIRFQNDFTSKKTSSIKRKNWHLRDISKDTIPGISLSKVYSELIKEKYGDTITIAIIDSPIDIEHNYLKDHIWVNRKEVSENGKDDDVNGYIDDINGWNFMGNSQGENIIFSNMEFTRIIKKYNPLFKNKQSHEIVNKEKYKLYKKALKSYDSMITYSQKEYDYYKMVHRAYYNTLQELTEYFPNTNLSTSKLDSLRLIYPEDTILQKKILKISRFEENIGKDEIDRNYYLYKNHMDILFNTKYNDRKITGDNQNDINDKYYGNNNVSHNLNILKHGTYVSGVFIKSKIQTNEIEGILPNVKIMPIAISGYGNEHDKDIALAIRYAVDNGAKVINMSFGKRYSLYKKWVFDAFKYAEKNNVLIVSSAGNDRLDLGSTNNYYPNDNVNNSTEVSNNFLLVGASTYHLNEKLVASFSNYGKTDVDIFAPGSYIYTTAPNNEYDFQRGTSMSASITSGVAALLFSYYPNLTAKEVKDIIMESGVSYDIMVNKPTRKKEKELVSFSSLSKSGKIVNAYNALLLAEKVSKKKKRN